MKFKDGKPVLVNSYSGSPVGMQTTILGRPVIINDEIAIKANMRLDIKKALGEAMVLGTVGSMAKASRSRAT